MTDPLLRVENLHKIYGGDKGLLGGTSHAVTAVDNVSFDIHSGEVLGLVGESGSGKSTIGRLILRLEDASAGKVTFEGQDMSKLSASSLRTVRRRMQVVFQDPYSSINPRMRIGRFVAEPLVIHGIGHSAADRTDRVAELLKLVGLSPDFAKRYPHEFSGGQRQRICIARAIALDPIFLVADEPITALDVSIQAQIINLFQDLQERLGLAYLFIAHDLSMVRYLCRRVAVMLHGRIVELGDVDAVFDNPRHAYTKALLSSVPVPDPDVERNRVRIQYDAASAPAQDVKLTEVEPNHFVLV